MLLVGVALVALSATPAPTAAPSTTAVRHLVYAFTWGTTSDVESRVGGFAEDGDNARSAGTPSGITDNRGGTEDKGRIFVVVEHEQSDRALVVEVSEQAIGSRSAAPATCVVFGNTDVLCDPNKKVNAEELTLLRFLGPTFVDPTSIGADRHWRIERANPNVSTTADYRIVGNDAGAMTIDETRVVNYTGARPLTQTIDGTIDYDFNRLAPRSISETAIERTESGESYQTVRSQTVLRLEDDSLAGATP